ncbi:Disease resistance protein RGA2 [Triticum urartu]|uniref:Disease resistance protein RGA2 n=2 Tax=Triticum urartu TaxID=4572 RepID=M7ZG47_TRIUA|nr:Disease resistance protein RGA2 [Triticum urartu]
MSLSAAIGFISGFNECVTFFQWAKSAISSLHSRWSSSQQQGLQGHVLQLESGLQCLRDTLPAMYDLIDKAEWRSHKHGVAKLLPNLKDVVSEAENLLDEFSWYEMKVQVEGSASQSPFIEFFDTVIQGNFNKLNAVQLRFNHLSSQLNNMGLHGVTQRFDKLVRPETTSFPNETKIFGRDEKLEQILVFLNVPTISKRKRETSSTNASTSTSTSSNVSNESRVSSLPILPIAGIGGVGKTTLAQHICSHQRVKSHFELIIWICVSDDFDVKRLTKEVIQSCTEKGATTDNLDSLQHALSNHLNNKMLLIVLDDMWDDALKENGQCWKRFCAPFRSVQEGSMMLITTRCPKVTEAVRTVEPVILEGLKDDIFWNFFASCLFGSENSDNYPELECIGRRILPKLKGSPLAAKTLGRMLSMDLQASHWNSILESEMWELSQEETDILPALRLSYMYLPFYLKQCFALCAVYPKDYIFGKECLAEIWVAEGFVETRAGVSVQDIGCQYFEDLVARSFFHKDVSGGYVIHDLMHDMVQKVSEHECFILRNKSDFDKVPQNVRHLLYNLQILYAKRFELESLPSDFNKLISLQKFGSYRLRYYAGGRTILDSVNGHGQGVRLIKNLNQFRGQLEIDNVGILSKDLAAEAELKNKKYLYELKLKMQSPGILGFPESQIIQNKEVLQVLQPPISLKSLFLQNYASASPKLSISPPFISQSINSSEIPAIGSFKFLTYVIIDGCENISCLEHFLHPDYVPAIKKIRIEKCKMLASVPIEKFTDFHFLEELEVCHCPNICSQGLVSSSLKTLSLRSSSLFGNIDCSSLTYFHLESEFVTSIQLQVWSLPALRELHIKCQSLTSIQSTGRITALSSLNVLLISDCDKLSTLGDFLTQEYVPAIERIEIRSCRELLSLPGERPRCLTYLKHLEIFNCPSLTWQRGLVLPSSLQRLSLKWCGDISLYVTSCLRNFTSLVSLSISGCKGITSIPGDIWCNNLASLDKLEIGDFPDLVSIGGAKAVAKIKVLIRSCPNLREAGKIKRRFVLREPEAPNTATSFFKTVLGLSEFQTGFCFQGDGFCTFSLYIRVSEDGNAGGVFMSVVFAPRLPDAEGDSSFCRRKYLVASPGGRLMVVLKESKEETTDKYSRPQRTCSFKVQVLDGEQWKEADDIGDAALFVGVNSSLCMSTREHPELRAGCIYYTENDTDTGPCKDGHNADEDNGVGVFSLKDGRAEKVEGLEQQQQHRSWLPPAWFIPSIHDDGCHH